QATGKVVFGFCICAIPIKVLPEVCVIRKICSNGKAARNPELRCKTYHYASIVLFASFVDPHLRSHLTHLETTVKKKSKTAGTLFKTEQTHGIYNSLDAQAQHAHFEFFRTRTVEIVDVVISETQLD